MNILIKNSRREDMKVEFDEPDGWKPPSLDIRYEKVTNGKNACLAKSPNGWLCYRKKGHRGQHEASSDLYKYRAWARWEDKKLKETE